VLVAYPFGMAIYFSLSDYWVGSPGQFVGLATTAKSSPTTSFARRRQNSFVFTGIALTLKTVLGRLAGRALARDVRFKPCCAAPCNPALGDPDGAVHARLVVDVRLALQRGELDGHPARPHERAGTELARPVELRHGRRHRRQHLARPALLRITVLAGLMSIPREFYEAAEVDGASSRQRFWHVTLPLLKPGCRRHPLLDIFTFSDCHIVQVLHAAARHTTHLFATPPTRSSAGGNPRPGGGPSRCSCSDAGHGRVPAAALHQEGLRWPAASARPGCMRRWTYANLAPFVFSRCFLLFHVRHVVQAQCELYNLKSVPFWIQTGVITDH